ncbi:MAG: hypothetical protein AAFV80_01490 [Bacteroidota bacterium]
MIKKTKFDLLDDEFILHLQEKELDPLELPESDQATKDKIDDLVEEGEKMWWIGTPNTEFARRSTQGVDLDSDTWILVRLTAMIPLVLLAFFPGALTGILLLVWLIGILFAKSVAGFFVNPPMHRNVRYYISNQDIQFIYPNLNESFEVNWEDVKAIKLLEKGTSKEIHFRLRNTMGFKTYNFHAGDRFFRYPVIQELQKMERIYERLLAFHKRWQTEQLLQNKESS